MSPSMNHQTEPLPLPGVVNLGCGRDWRPECLNVDINPQWQPDVVLDLNQPLPWHTPLESRRFGTIRLHENQFDGLLALDVLEHLPNLITAMTSALTLLKPGGTLTLQVPYDLSLGAWQDPTHVRAFNENSWSYFGEWHWYLGWHQARFDLAEQTFLLTPYGMELHRKGLTQDHLLRQPRAVDAMKVVLKKRLLPPENAS